MTQSRFHKWIIEIGLTTLVSGAPPHAQPSQTDARRRVHCSSRVRPQNLEVNSHSAAPKLSNAPEKRRTSRQGPPSLERNKDARPPNSIETSLARNAQSTPGCCARGRLAQRKACCSWCFGCRGVCNREFSRRRAAPLQAFV